VVCVSPRGKVAWGCNEWQLKALSLLDKYMQGWSFARGYSYAEFTCRNVCAGWVFPIERSTLEEHVAP